MDINERITTAAATFSDLARSGKTDEAVEYYFSNAAFDGVSPVLRHETDGLHTPPMNELYKGVKE